MLLNTTQSMLFGDSIRGPLTRADDERKPLVIHKILERILIENEALADQIAITQTDGNQITFGHLNDLANQLAARLFRAIKKHERTSGHHPSSDWIVAISMTPSIDLIISLLAIFKMGSAYVPIDCSYPYNRMVHILEDSKPACLLTSNTSPSTALLSATQETNIPVLDVNQLNNNENDIAKEITFNSNHTERDLAVIFYTFGSSGIFRGVRLSHETILQQLEWQWTRFPYELNEVGCFKTSLSFVESISEIWGPILSGKPLQIVPKQIVQNTEKFIELLEDAKITRLFLVPSLLKAIITTLNSRRESYNNKFLSNLKMWICSGEVLSAQLLLKFYNVFEEDTKIWNIYDRAGDVRYAAFESRADVMDCLLERNKIPIGFPMFHCARQLLDSFNKLVEKDEILEFYVTGIHLISDRNSTNNRYSCDTTSGDYYNQFMNASGHKPNNITLKEISYVVNKLEKVSPTAINNIDEESQQEVLAFVIPKTHGRIDFIREELTNKLDPYMKLNIVEVEKMPLLSNGKVDQKKLRQIFQEQRSHPTIHDAAMRRKERILLSTVGIVLGDRIRAVEGTDNFFDIGGNSINAVWVVNKLRDRGYHLNMTDFLGAAQLKDLVMLLSDAKIEGASSSPNSYIIELFPTTTN